MIPEVISRAQEKAARKARTAMLGLGATLCLLVGIGFMTLAAWLYLTNTMPAREAALILGAVYVGFGLLILAGISLRQRAHERSEPEAKTASAETDPAQMVNEIMAAFTSGVQAGRKARL